MDTSFIFKVMLFYSTVMFAIIAVGVAMQLWINTVEIIFRVLEVTGQ
jgi:hypothetical protein